MTDWKQYVDHYIQQLGGPNWEDAYLSLIEADDVIIPLLLEAFRNEQDSDIRAILVKVIWQRRFPEAIEFLAEALRDQAPEVWKTALDGLVSLGSVSALDILQSAKQRIVLDSTHSRVQVEWIDEAIQEVKKSDL